MTDQGEFNRSCDLFLRLLSVVTGCKRLHLDKDTSKVIETALHTASAKLHRAAAEGAHAADTFPQTESRALVELLCNDSRLFIKFGQASRILFGVVRVHMAAFADVVTIRAFITLFNGAADHKYGIDLIMMICEVMQWLTQNLVIVSFGCH